jgi:hypothetical protein
MKASSVKVSELKTAVDCFEAIDAIEMDIDNCLGGHKAWVSGQKTYLTVAAKNKIEAINRKLDKFVDEDDA